MGASKASLPEARPLIWSDGRGSAEKRRLKDVISGYGRIAAENNGSQAVCPWNSIFGGAQSDDCKSGLGGGKRREAGGADCSTATCFGGALIPCCGQGTELGAHAPDFEAGRSWLTGMRHDGPALDCQADHADHQCKQIPEHSLDPQSIGALDKHRAKTPTKNTYYTRSHHELTQIKVRSGDFVINLQL